MSASKMKVERFEAAVRANGYRTTTDATEAEYRAAKADLIGALALLPGETSKFLPTEDGEFNGNLSIVPPNCSGYSFVFEPGVLHVKKDGSGHLVVNEEDFVLEDDRTEGPDGPEGSVHWIVRLSPSEIISLRDFLNGAPAPLPVAVKAATARWRIFEDTTAGHWGIELEQARNDDDAILHPIRVHRDTVAQIVDAHNAALSSPVGGTEESYQDRVSRAHGPLFDDDPTDIAERRARFFEEANETCQAFGMSREEAHALVDYTYGRPVGEPKKEVGAAMVTLTSLCVVAGVDLMECADADLRKLQRPETIERIRAKRSTRHGRGPLPGLDPSASPTPAPDIAASRAKDSFGNDLIERELVSIILRMSRHLPADKPAAQKLHDGILDYLRRKGLMPSPLRAQEMVVQSVGSDIAALRAKADAFDRIVAARGKHVDATATYNARLELVQAERARGNWSLKIDPEYRNMCNAQKAFILSAQAETDAALAKGERP